MPYNIHNFTKYIFALKTLTLVLKIFCDSSDFLQKFFNQCVLCLEIFLIGKNLKKYSTVFAKPVVSFIRILQSFRTCTKVIVHEKSRVCNMSFLKSCFTVKTRSYVIACQKKERQSFAVLPEISFLESLLGNRS